MMWPFGDMQMFSMGVLLCDPPWDFKNYSAKGEAKNPKAHYDCMNTDDICALPVGHLAKPNSACLLWCTAPMLDHGFRVLSAWGFQFKTAGAWAKQSKTGKKWAFGPGYILRSAAEFFLVGTMGNPVQKSKSVRNLLVDPVREHSRKPDSQYEMAEALFEGPYAEIFSRCDRPGWSSFGNETGKFNGDQG